MADFTPLLDAIRQRRSGVAASGYRTPQRNAEVGGATNSYHMQRDAAGNAQANDITWQGMDWNDVSTIANDPAIRQIAQQNGWELVSYTHGTGPHLHVEPLGNSTRRVSGGGNTMRVDISSLPDAASDMPAAPAAAPAQAPAFDITSLPDASVQERRYVGTVVPGGAAATTKPQQQFQWNVDPAAAQRPIPLQAPQVQAQPTMVTQGEASSTAVPTQQVMGGEEFLDPLRSAVAGTGQAASSIGDFLEYLNVSSPDDAWRQHAAMLQSVAPQNPTLGDKFIMSLPSSLALMALPLGATAAAGRMALGAVGSSAVGALGVGASRAVESAMEAGGVYRQMIDAGKPVEQARQAALQAYRENLALYGLDVGEYAVAFGGAMFPALRGIASKLPRLSGVDRGLLAAAKFIASAGMEGAEEVAQTNIGARATGMPASAEEYRESFILGALTGGAFQTVATVGELAARGNIEQVNNAASTPAQPAQPGLAAGAAQATATPAAAPAAAAQPAAPLTQPTTSQPVATNVAPAAETVQREAQQPRISAQVSPAVSPDAAIEQEFAALERALAAEATPEQMAQVQRLREAVQQRQQAPIQQTLNTLQQQLQTLQQQVSGGAAATPQQMQEAVAAQQQEQQRQQELAQVPQQLQEYPATGTQKEKNEYVGELYNRRNKLLRDFYDNDGAKPYRDALLAIDEEIAALPIDFNNLYHLTMAENADSISARGFDTQKSGTVYSDRFLPGGISFAPSDAVVNVWGLDSEARMPLYEKQINVSLDVKPSEVMEITDEEQLQGFTPPNGIKVVVIRNPNITGGREIVVYDSNIIKINNIENYSKDKFIGEYRSGQRGAALVGMGIPQLVDRVAQSQTVQEIRTAAAELGRRVYAAGSTTYNTWRTAMRQALGNAWQRVAPVLRQVWRDVQTFVRDEAGMAGQGRTEAQAQQRGMFAPQDVAAALQRADQQRALARDIENNYRPDDINNRYEQNSGLSDFFSGIIIPISTRLGYISQGLRRALRNFEFNNIQRQYADLQAVNPWMKKYGALSAQDKDALDLALKNSDVAAAQAIMERNGMVAEYAAVQQILDRLRRDAIEMGYEVGFIPDYFPRSISDSRGLTKELYGYEERGAIRETIRKREQAIGRTLTEEEKAEVANSVIRGYGNALALSGPSNIKGRKLLTLTPELNKYYADSMVALTRYITRMNEAVEARRFFGKGNDIDGSIGRYVANLVEQNAISPAAENETIALLRARFGMKPMTGGAASLRDMGYITTMGNVLSAITQIGDLYSSVYMTGLRIDRPIVNVLRGMFGKSAITTKDIGIDRIAQEYAKDPTMLSRALDSVFKWSGLTAMDKLGKETLINTTIDRFRREARNGRLSPRMEQRLRNVFGDETAQVMDDLRSGRTTENVKLLAFNTLLDFQPVALSEMPRSYLTAPNGRIFYMLKTYAIKQLDVLRREGLDAMVNGRTPAQKMKGFTSMMYLAFLMMAANMGADEIKDKLLGRDTPWDDMIIDNILRLFGVSKYVIYKARGSRTPAREVIISTVAPPASVVEYPITDLMGFVKKGSDYPIKDMQTLQLIPYFGKFYHWWFGAGRGTIERREAKEQRQGNGRLNVQSLEAGGPKVERLQ